MFKKLWHWLFWSLTIVLLLLTLTAVGIHFYARTEHFDAVLRAQILSAVNKSLNGNVQFQKLSGSLWRGLRFHQVVVSQEENIIFSAPVVSMKFGLLEQIYAFFSNSKIRIGELRIQSPQLTLFQDKDGQWNVLRLVETDQTDVPATLTVLFSRLVIEDGTILINTADRREARLTSIATAASVDLSPAGVKIRLNKFAVQLYSAGLPPATLQGALSLATTGNTASLTLDHLNVSTDESHLTIAGTVTDLSHPRLNLDLDLRKGSAKELARFLPNLPLRQNIVANLRASGTLSALTLSGSLGAPDGRIVGSIGGNWSTSEPQLRGKLAFQDFVLDKVLAIPSLKGKINGQVDFQGSSLETVRVSTRSKISALTVNEWEVGDVTGTGTLKNKMFDFAAKLDETMGNTEVRGTIGWSPIPSYEVTLRARSLDVRTVAGGRDDLPRTRLNVDAWVRGSGTDPNNLQADIKLTLYPSEISDIPINEGRAEGSIRDGALVLRRARLAANGSTLNASGTIASVTQPTTGKITYALSFNEIKPWLKLVNLNGSGQAKMNGTLSGSIDAPRLEGKASVNDFRLASNRIENGTVHWTLTRSAKNPWQGKLGLVAKRVNAGIPLQTLEAQVTLDGIRPAKLSVRIVARDSDQRVHRLKSQVLYSAARTEMTLQELNLQLPNGVWHNPEPIRLVMAEQTVRVGKFLLTRGKQILNVEGSIGLQGKQDLSLQVKQFPLADLRPYLKDAPEFTGILFLAMRVTGTPGQPVIDADMNVDMLTLAGQPYDGLNAKGSYRQERATVDLKLAQDQSHQLHVTGMLPVYIGWGATRSPAVLGETNLRIHSESLSPAFLSVLTKDVDNLKGRLSLDINLRGPVHALAPNGTLQFHNGAAGIRSLGLSLTDIDLQARLTPAAVHITRAVLRSGEGWLNGSGQFAYHGLSFGAIDLTLNADDVQVINTREYKAKATGKLFASGSWQQPSIRGSVDLKGTLRPDLALLKTNGRAAQDTTITVVKSESDLASTQRQAKEPTSTKNGTSMPGSQGENDFYGRLGFDVATVISRDSWLYLDDGSVELAGQLRITKQPQEKLTVSGEVDGVRGWYSFKGRRFQIAKARLNFTGGGEIDPALDIVGRHRIPRYLIEFVVGGYASKPTLVLRSDPPLDQADVLSVLLFGKPVKALSEGEQINLQSQAALVTADFFAADLKGSITEQLGLDTLDISVGNDVSAGQIGVGKYVTDDVFVSTKQQIGDEHEQEYSVEYNIAPEWQIKSSTDPEGKSSIDLFWRKRY